jgi:hypothetical protein
MPLNKKESKCQIQERNAKDVLGPTRLTGETLSDLAGCFGSWWVLLVLDNENKKNTEVGIN